jgi:hypothetical protein
MPEDRNTRDKQKDFLHFGNLISRRKASCLSSWFPASETPLSGKAGIEVLSTGSRSVRFRLRKENLAKNRELLKQLFSDAYEENHAVQQFARS